VSTSESRLVLNHLGLLRVLIARGGRLLGAQPTDPGGCRLNVLAVAALEVCDRAFVLLEIEALFRDRFSDRLRAA
jgi:hypothetical protein